MQLLFILLELAGTVALLLWGIHMVRTGVERAFGAKLRHFLSRMLRNRMRAFLAGVGVTAILQSSTATGLMVAGFAASGMVELVPALAVILGANVGTTLIVQVASFNIAAFAPILVLAGLIMFRRARAGAKDFGRVLIGLGLVLTALHGLVVALEPYERTPQIAAALNALSDQPFIGAVIAAAIAWAAHSSVAVVLFIMSLSERDMITPLLALALVIGANVGTAINPVIEGHGAGDPALRRVATGNLINRLVGAVIALAAAPFIAPFLTQIEPSGPRAVADFHTLFNLVLAAAFFPFLNPFARLLLKLMPARARADDPGRPLYLDPGVRDQPVVALGAACRESARLADALESMLQGLRRNFERADRRLIGDTRRLDDVLDRLNRAIKDYVTSLDDDAMTDDDRRKLIEILSFSTNMEQAGDIVDNNLFALIGKMEKRGLNFSREGWAELVAMLDRLVVNTRLAATIFITGDMRAARMLAAEKNEFRTLEVQATQSHYQRLRSGRQESAETSAIHLDALRDLKQINSHLVAAAAYPLLERSDELLPSRIRAAG